MVLVLHRAAINMMSASARRITRGKRCFTKLKPHAGRRKGRKCSFLSLVILTFDFDIQTRPERGTKRVFRVNLAQIRSTVPETFHTETKSHSQRQKQNLTQFTACGKYSVNFL